MGSTSIKGLGGKGIIDILIGVKKDKIKGILKKLQTFGYDFKKHASSKDRKFLQKDYNFDEKTQRFHIHLVENNESEWKIMAAFRDYLRKNKTITDEYIGTVAE